jgi:serine/threonine-protein kinase
MFFDNKVSIARGMLREQIERDAPQRELAIATWMIAVSILSALICLALYEKIGQQLSLCLASILTTVAIYYVALCSLLRRKLYHRFMAWINALIEVSIPSVIFIIDWTIQGPEFALTAPVLTIWGSLIAINGLRMSSVLALCAGMVAALEYVGLYAVLAFPMLPADTMETLKPAMIATRAFLLICAGIITAIFARHFLRKAEEALGAVRERDWMGKYLIHDRIGVGGMAEVFSATYAPEGGFEKRVALKRVLPKLAKDPKFRAMFRGEAELGSWLAHPNIVQILDLGSHNDSLYLAMEFIDGVTLKRLLDAHPNGLPPAQVAYIALCLAKALEYTHNFKRQGKMLGLVHQDVNPTNILLSRQAEVKLSDFGIVRAIDGVESLESQSDITGKLAYLAPEQVTGGEVDGRTDLFSLGLTLHECLTGRAVFDFSAQPGNESASSVNAVMAICLVVEEPICNPRTIKPDIPDELADIIMKLTERDLQKRYANAGLVIADLQQLPPSCAASPASESMLARYVQEVV